jgi:PAS domain S-box-containing protein
MENDIEHANGNIHSKSLNETVSQKVSYTATEVLELQKELLAKQKQMEERMWVDSTLSKFDDILRMNYDKSLNEFSDVVVYNIAKITNAIRGAFYTVVDSYIEATGCYACTLSSLASTRFEIGEGLIGQSVKSLEIVYFNDLSPHNLVVKASSGTVSAKSVIVVPLIFNEKAYGVLELLFLNNLEDKYKDLLSRLSRNIATMLQSIQSNAKTKELLVSSIQQTESLQSAEEELRQNMEEIQAIRDDIERKNEDLASQMAVTERLKREMEIRTSIIDKTTLVTEADIYGNITYVNEKFCQVAKYTPEECIGKPHSILRHPDNPKDLFKDLWTTIKSGRIFQGTYPNRAKDGSTYWVEATIAPVFGENGDIIKYIGVRYDVTERIEKANAVNSLLHQAQQTTEELRAQEEELRQNMEELSATQEDVERNNRELAKQILTVDALKREIETRNNIINKTTLVTESDIYGNVTYVNEKFCEVAKYTPQECIGKPHSMLRHPDNPKELFKELWTTIKSGRIFQGTYPNRAKDGSTYWVEATIAPVFGENGEIVKYIGVRYDITERIAKEQSIQVLLQKTQQNAEEIRAQEEELRQNMEELVATQEGITRANKELETMMKASDECLFIIEISPDNTLLRCNDKFLEQTGYKAEELLFKDYSSLMDNAEWANYQDTLAKLKNGEIVRKDVKRIAKNKSILLLDATYYPVLDRNKQLLKIFKLSYNLGEKLAKYATNKK